jgi:branched-chain amino acid transport system permease protein
VASISQWRPSPAQFFILWFLTKVGWVTNYSSSGVITAQQVVILGYALPTPEAKVPAGAVDRRADGARAKNMARGNTGRSWMAVRDMDVAGRGDRHQAHARQAAGFRVSSFYCGVAGALFAYAYLGTVEPEAFSLDLSFRILFMIIIGGMGTVLGAFLGSAFVTLLPVLLSVSVRFLDRNLNLHIAESTISNLELMVFGGLIIFFLIVEPHGLARLWQIGKEKLRLWPFPH